jgi:hypothetical protein
MAVKPMIQAFRDLAARANPKGPDEAR